MTRDEAKTILQLYRPGTSDDQEAEFAEALSVAKQNPELGRWLVQHCAQYEAARSKMRQIPVPAGLKEQIISESKVQAQKIFRKKLAGLAAACAILLVIGWFVSEPRDQPDDDTFANFRARMISTALRGYAMDLSSTNQQQIATFLAQRKTVDYKLTAALAKIPAIGCALEDWQGKPVAMICFQTGRPLPPGEKNDLWLFVVDRAAVKKAPLANDIQFAKVNKLMTATWTDGNRLYLLGTFGDKNALKQLL